MEIHHLRYFAAVAEELSFSRAAERLHMASSPLSRRVKDLEHELGVPLFVRGYHSVALTEAGLKLWPLVKDVLRRLDELPAVLPGCRADEQRTVSIGIGPEVSPDLRTKLTEAVRAIDPPQAVLRLTAASTGPLTKGVLRGDLDLAFVHGRVSDPHLRSIRVESQRAAMVVARGAGFDGRESAHLSELTHLPYISLKETAAPLVYRATDELLMRHGVRGRIHVDTNNQADLVPNVVANQAFAVCGREFGATRKVFLEEPVLFLSMLDVSVELRTYAVWRGDTYEDKPSVRELVAAIKTSLSEFVRHGT